MTVPKFVSPEAKDLIERVSLVSFVPGPPPSLKRARYGGLLAWPLLAVPSSSQTITAHKEQLFAPVDAELTVPDSRYLS